MRGEEALTGMPEGGRMVVRPELIERFNADHADSVCTAFLIMRFSEKRVYAQIHEALKRAFESLGIRLLRADDLAYSDDLFENVRLYADRCKFGVAVFDRIEGDYFNPNVSLEVGYMLGREKPILLLKDASINVLPSDLLGKLYVELNVHDPADGLRDRVQKWIDDNRINPCSKRLSVVLRLHIPRWEYAATKDLVAGIPLFVSNAGPAYYRGIRPSGENFIVDYDVSTKFAAELKRKHRQGDFSYLAGLTIIEIESSDDQPELLDYIYVDRASENFEVQYCFLESFAEFGDLAQRAKQYIGPITADVKQCSIFLARRDGLLYIHSNFLLPRKIYPTKMLASRLDGIEYVLPLVTNSTCRTFQQDDRLALAHMLHVNYIVDSSFGDDLPFSDMMGATKIRRIKAAAH